MLDRTKLMHELQNLSQSLFVSYADEYTIAEQTWQRIVNDPTFIYKIKSATVPWALPTWSGRLDCKEPVAVMAGDYQVLSVDGSQIYPDRHQGTGCFLINIGTVAITYGNQSKAYFASKPFVFTSDDMRHEGAGFALEFIDCLRQEYEYAAALDLVRAQTEISSPRILLFDGSLIFWSLVAKEPLKNVFFSRYIDALTALRATNVPCAWYISLPKNKEISHLIRAALCNFDAQQSDSCIEHVIDTSVAHFFIPPLHRSTIFKTTVPLCDEYPAQLYPHFFYMHNGDEMVRVEIPAWIVDDAAALTYVVQGVLDQARKGRGYPVALAEAHEQAVVKGADRDFFYQLIAKFGVEQKQRIAHSQKSIKKRGIGI